MRFIVCYSVLVLLFSVQTAFAQESIRVRTGEHAGYSRLVFDWKKRTQYSVEASGQELVIEFETPARVESAPAASATATNINTFKVLSENPLRISITIPKGARTRNFWAGDRVVLDVYDPPGGARKKSTQTASAQKKPAPVKEKTKVVEKPPAKPVEKKSQEIASKASLKGDENTVSAKAVPVEPVEAIRVQVPSEEGLKAVGRHDAREGEPKAIMELVDEVIPTVEKKISSARPNLIMLTSTKTQGLGVFELNDNIWIVSDQADLRLVPEVRGPDAEKILPLQSKDVVGGKVFKVNTLDNYSVRGQGGGLVWRVIVSPDPHEATPVELLREGVQEGKGRSGKVIWPFEEAGQVIDVEDPVTGAVIKVVTMKNSTLLAGPPKDFVDFRTLNTHVGIAVMPKVDDLEVRITKKGVEVSRPQGLALLTDEKLDQISIGKKEAQENAELEQASSAGSSKRIYDFRNWQMGGVDALVENGVILMSRLNDMSQGERIESLLTLAKMYISNAQGAEALGFLRLAQTEMPDVAYSPEFIALRGAAKALDWKSEPAFADLSAEVLQPFEEIGYWKAFALADLGDWSQAQSVLPQNLGALYDYSDFVFNRLGLVVAEIALRNGNVQQADKLLHAIEKNEKDLFDPQKAALAYLKGEAARQRGKVDETKKIWEPLTVGEDDLYRARAGLALTRLRVDEKELTPKKAIDNLERLRYAWRGDYLEAQINYWLGQTYFEDENYVKGLNIMREAASFAAGTDLGRTIAGDMKDAFATLFLSDELNKVPPPDAAALYEQFSELAPTGDSGDKVVESLADHLVKADLLGRASSLLSHQLDHRLKGSEAYRIAVHLAAIYLLDEEPRKAMKTLGRATSELQKLPEEMQTQDRYLEISLLRARGLSELKRADQALALLKDLPHDPQVNKLRADIAWNSSYWDDAGEAFEDIILDRNFSLTRPLEEDDAKLILHRAVALNLAGDRIALANMREKYSDAMVQTKHSRAFDVISRPRQSATLANRETLMGIVSEVDMFSDFMNSYREKSLSTQDDDLAAEDDGSKS